MKKFIQFSLLLFLIFTIKTVHSESRSYSGKCGKGIGSCRKDECCSKYGWCGKSNDYCGKGCQSEFGKCNSDNKISKDGRCGKGIGSCKNNECCSKYGWCGKSNDHCGKGCQSEFGKCKSTSTTTTTSTTSTKPNASSQTPYSGKCGKGIGSCRKGECCSKYGWCGKSNDYCGKGCQSDFGECKSASTTTTTTTTTKPNVSSQTPYNGKCGKGIGSCKKGECCSKYGWCGKSNDYCGKGCQSDFGECKSASTTTTTTTTTTKPNDSSQTPYSGKCGKGIGSCGKGECCSKYGWCGKSNDYCGKGCQPDFGVCNNDNPVNNNENPGNNNNENPGNNNENPGNNNNENPGNNNNENPGNNNENPGNNNNENPGNNNENPVNNSTDISNPDFDFSFLKLENEKKNMLYSPLSIRYALKMLEEGADGNTYREINKLIGNEELPKYTSIDKVLSLANGLFIRDTYYERIKKSYINTLKEKYDAEVVQDEFKDAKDVNQWIEDKTLGIIKKMLKDEMVQNPRSVMILINALAIDMKWYVPFEVSNTYGRDFYMEDGQKKIVTMMYQGGISNEYVAYYIDNDITALTMDLKNYNGTQFEFMAIMPKENLSAYVENVSKEQINQIDKKLILSSDEEAGINVEIPKFKFSYDLELKKDLKDLGIKDAFNEVKADLSKMEDKKELYVSEALHKADIEFSEEGVKAAAATVIIIGEGDAPREKEPVDVVINKPFMFIIRDKKTKDIWFTGTVYEPNLWDSDKEKYKIYHK